MNRLLSLSRAARLVGIKRGTLQKRIQAGEILTFEGMLTLDELLKAYPDTKLSDERMLELAEQNKANAVYKPLPDAEILPSNDLLQARLHNLSLELVNNKLLVEKYGNIVNHVVTELEKIPDSDDIQSILKWLNQTLHDFEETSISPENYPSHLITSDTLLSLMTAHIRILPSGHDFFSEGVSSILEAGLRSGMALDYACSNGNCGKCKARLINGQIKQIQHHDYVLPEQEKNSGYFLMCCNAAITDTVIEATEATQAEDIPEQTITTKVKSIDTSHPDAALLHLKTPRSQRLRFLAGQNVTLGGNAGGDNIPVATHSISSCPCDDMNLHFQIPNIPGNAFSEYVFNTLKSGDALNLIGPHGRFTLNEDSYHSLVFIAWHTGFAPVKSLIEHAMALDIAETIHLYWITDKKESRYLDNLCRSWEDALDNFYYSAINLDIETCTEEDLLTELNTICNELTKNDALSDFDFYIAGTDRLIENFRKLSQSKNLDASQLICDTIKHD